MGLQLRTEISQAAKRRVKAQLREDRARPGMGDGLRSRPAVRQPQDPGFDETPTRLSLATEVRQQFRGPDVVDILERVTRDIGCPKMIRLGNGLLRNSVRASIAYSKNFAYCTQETVHGRARKVVVDTICKSSRGAGPPPPRQFRPWRRTVKRLSSYGERHYLKPIAMLREKCAQAPETALHYSVRPQTGIAKIALFDELEGVCNNGYYGVAAVMCRLEQADCLARA
jgi:hypothetical protein